MKELPIFVNNKESHSRRISQQQPQQQQRLFVLQNAPPRRKKRSSSRWYNCFFYDQDDQPNNDEQFRRKAINAMFFLLIFLYLYMLFRTEEMLEEYRLQRGNNAGRFVNANNTKKETSDDEIIRKSTIYFGSDRFILFKEMGFGQGTGNIMAGLLAAHLLGEEFNRVVCVEKKFVSFHAAFELKDLHIRSLCETLVEYPPLVAKDDLLQAISFQDAPNECHFQERLSLDTKVIRFEGNSYPRWPKVPHGFFVKFYQPRHALLDILPYTKQPETVVHLRDPDGEWDTSTRPGLDNASFMELGSMLPNDTYLVTNRVDWYKLFHDKFNWSHPNWSIVRHSISGMTWKAQVGKADRSMEQQQQQQGPMQMWADWYTVLMAKHVYHTHSEFSNSAVHWMNIQDANVLNGINKTTGKLTFRPEAWISDGLCPALVDRTKKSNDDPNSPLLEMHLKACDTPIVQHVEPGKRPITGARIGSKAIKMENVSNVVT